MTRPIKNKNVTPSTSDCYLIISRIYSKLCGCNSPQIGTEPVNSYREQNEKQRPPIFQILLYLSNNINGSVLSARNHAILKVHFTIAVFPFYISIVVLRCKRNPKIIIQRRRNNGAIYFANWEILVNYQSIELKFSRYQKHAILLLFVRSNSCNKAQHLTAFTKKYSA